MTFVYYTPIHYQISVIMVARIDLLRNLVAGPILGSNFSAYLPHRLQHGIVELLNLHAALLAQLVQRQRIVSIELRERACVLAGRTGFDQLPVAGIEAFPDPLVDAEGKAGTGFMKPGIVVVTHRLVQTDRHVEPGTNPFAGVNGAGLKRWHDLSTGQRHHASAQPPQHLCARAGHPVAQAPEPQRRSDLMREPPAHLAAAARAKQRLDVELAAELIPQLLPSAVLYPGYQLVGGEAERNGREEIQRWRLACEVALERMIHVDEATAHRLECFERAYECASREDLDLDAPAARLLDGACDASRAGLQTRHVRGPVRHQFELANSLGNCRRREACSNGQ